MKGRLSCLSKPWQKRTFNLAVIPSMMLSYLCRDMTLNIRNTVQKIGMKICFLLMVWISTTWDIKWKTTLYQEHTGKTVLKFCMLCYFLMLFCEIRIFFTVRLVNQRWPLTGQSEMAVDCNDQFTVITSWLQWPIVWNDQLTVMIGCMKWPVDCNDQLTAMTS